VATSNKTQLREAERYGSTEDGKTCSEIEVEIDDTQANISQLTADIDRLKRIIDEKHTGRPAFKTEVEKFDFGLDESVKVWSDFSGVAYHPRSINLLKNTTHDDTFDIYSQGELSSLEVRSKEAGCGHLKMVSDLCFQLRWRNILITFVYSRKSVIGSRVSIAWWMEPRRLDVSRRGSLRRYKRSFPSPLALPFATSPFLSDPKHVNTYREYSF
jgi:hypothetical protein